MIMKKHIKLLVLVVAAVVIAACNPTPSITLSTSSIDAPVGGDSYEVTITSNYDWTATPADSWVKVSQGAGPKGTVTVKVTVNSNTSPDARSTKVTFACEGLSQDITVTQGQKDILQLADNAATTVSWEAQTVEIMLSSNVDYQLTIDPPVDWVSIVATKGLVSSKLTVTVEENDSFTARDALVYFSGGADLPGFTLTQEGRPQELKIWHNQMNFKAPVIFGFNMSGMIDWGDGSVTRYASGTSHTYAREGEYVIVIDATQATTASISDFVGVTKVDLTHF